ncbi:hypothetical protein Cgig2_020417 [Carnegiea gigantea]|uniref:Cytochrome P450 n=1 Tax=Carnegiea gigantea TaxID=171969 RepID=A0A9Q1QCP1_9CARY|nr:hypothetical protein Cgig2_020417 [Carnegiea gigantea]
MSNSSSLYSPEVAPLLVSTIIFIIFLTFLAYYRSERPRLKLPPGPTTWPALGNLYVLKLVLFRCCHEWAQMIGLIIWPRKYCKDHDHALANRYRIKSQVKFTKNGLDLPWADYGPHYVTVMKLCTSELFNNEKIEAFRPIREYEVGAVIEKYIGKVALNHITRLTFGKRFLNREGKMDEQGQEFMDILYETRTIKRVNVVVKCTSWLQWICLPYDQAFDKHIDRLNRFGKEILEEDNNCHFVHALLSSKAKNDLSQDTMIGLLWGRHSLLRMQR